MRTIFLVLSLVCGGAFGSLLIQESSKLPITTVRVVFRAGSVDDPKGKQGAAALTAEILREGGVKARGKLPARSRAQLEEFLYPYALGLGADVEKEQTTFEFTANAADSELAFDVLSQILLAPAFNGGELERLKAETLDALEKRYPREDQEDLGKAALDWFLYGKNHPYAHVVEGTIAGVKSITVKDLKAFQKKFYTKKRVTIGIAGVVKPGLKAKAAALLAALPAGDSDRTEIPAAPAAKGLDLLVVKGPFEATGVHFGQALDVRRGQPDFPALYLSSMAFGKHRSFVGRLMHVVREERGLNYGTYSYVEDFPGGGHAMTEPTQAARQRQAFTVWARPTPPENGCFVLRQVYREIGNLAVQGLTESEFALGRSHLMGYIPILGTEIERALGYAIDSRFYGINGDYLKDTRAKVEGLNQLEVNEILRKNLHPENLRIVVVTQDTDRFVEAVLAPSCGITYPPGITKSKEVLDEDEKISTHLVPIQPERIKQIASEDLFR